MNMNEVIEHSAAVIHENWDNEAVVRMQAGGYEAVLIPGIGSNLFRLRDLKRGLDLLRSPQENDLNEFRTKTEIYGIPFLYPPNRIVHGRFTAKGRTYQFPVNSDNVNHIHGFFHRRPWHLKRAEVIEQDTAVIETVFLNTPSSDFFEYLPHEFECRLTYTLSQEGLLQTATINNLSDSDLPLGIGFHTAFKVPFHPSGCADDYRLRVSVGKSWELHKIMIPTGKMLPLDEQGEKLRTDGIKPVGQDLDKLLYSAEPLTWKNRPFHGALIEDQANKLVVVYEIGPQYPFWVIWNDKGDKGYVCPEPQSWTINAPNIDLPDTETGFRLLKPQESWQETCRIYVEDNE